MGPLSVVGYTPMGLEHCAVSIEEEADQNPPQSWDNQNQGEHRKRQWLVW